MYQYASKDKTQSKRLEISPPATDKSHAQKGMQPPIQSKSLFSPSSNQENVSEKSNSNYVSCPAQLMPLPYSPLQMQSMPKQERMEIQPIPISYGEEQKKLEPASFKPNNTGIPLQMKEKFESLSGFSFDDVKVHYNSDKPAQLQALAYTQGNQVHIGPGQEKHLSHELGHVVQQKQDFVKPTGYVNGLPVNTDIRLERLADRSTSIVDSMPLISSSVTTENTVPQPHFDKSAQNLKQRPISCFNDMCIQAKWERLPVLGDNVFENRKGMSSWLYLRSEGELYINGMRVDPIDEKIQNDFKRELDIDFYETEQKKDDAREAMTSVPSAEEQKKDDAREAMTSVHSDEEQKKDDVREDMPFILSDVEHEKDEPPIDSPIEYDGANFELNYLRRLNQSLYVISGHHAASKSSVSIDIDQFNSIIEAKALKRSKEYLWEKYMEAHNGVLRLKAYGRAKGALCKELLEDRAMYLRSYKSCKKPMFSIYKEVESGLCALARERITAEIARVWANLMHKTKSLESIKSASDKTNDIHEQSGSKSKKGVVKSAVQQTRENLVARSLLVLPEGLPLAGIFPNNEAMRFEREGDDRDRFSELNKHANRLVVQYNLHHGDNGVIESEEGCVCIMYLKEYGDDCVTYKPAFGISGFFSGKGEAGIKIGFEAMGIPAYLLDSEDKPTALRTYLEQCEVLGVRKPSMQACLSYLQNASEYGDIERWPPVLCAEPAIVMAIHNLYHDTSELVLSFPYQGKLLGEAPQKKPIPKYTCARCAVAEKSFGAAIKGSDEQSVERERVKMGIKNSQRIEQLFDQRYIRNPDKEPFGSKSSAYSEKKGVIRRFLRHSSQHGFAHGLGKLKPMSNISTFNSIAPSSGRRLPTTDSPQDSSKSISDGKQYAHGIFDDNGNQIQILDPPSTQNNCFFAAIQAATQINLNANTARQDLRVALENQNLFSNGRMVNSADLAALSYLSQETFANIFGTTGFTVQIYGTSGLLQSTSYGVVTAHTPVIINLRFNHYVAKV